MSAPLHEQRCRGGSACEEVLARIKNAERADRELAAGDPGADRIHAAASRLRRLAEQHAAAHRYGQKGERP